MATMRDVAKAAGVSVATVSATLSGAAFVSADLRRRVLAAVENLGYQPNSMASMLKRGRSSLLGLVVPDVTNPFFTAFVDVVQRAARDAGFTVLLGVSDNDVERESGLLRLMRSHQAAGTILCAAGGAADYAALVRYAGAMKLVAVDNAPPEMQVDAVVLDNRRAAALATGHILALGHVHIATIAGPAHRLPARERLDGFLEVMAAAGHPVAPDLVRRGDFREDRAFEACRDLLAVSPRPTAVFVANNHMLIGVMRAIAAAGLEVPGDISVASIDDFPWATAFDPALTTVRQPVADMAEAALALLLARIDGATGEPRRRVFRPELVVRASCAAPPDARSGQRVPGRP